MTTSETELKALMLASLDGSAVSYRSLLERLSSRQRAHYKGKLGRFGRGAMEVEDLVARNPADTSSPGVCECTDVRKTA